MFFIHGGSFNIGSGNSDLYGGDYLSAAEVVLVTCNYRLGPLGEYFFFFFLLQGF